MHYACKWYGYSNGTNIESLRRSYGLLLAVVMQIEKLLMRMIKYWYHLMKTSIHCEGYGLQKNRKIIFTMDFLMKGFGRFVILRIQGLLSGWKTGNIIKK